MKSISYINTDGKSGSSQLSGGGGSNVGSIGYGGGGSSLGSQAEGQFISKVNEDTANKLIHFLQGIDAKGSSKAEILKILNSIFFGNYEKGLRGGYINKSGDAELRSLVLRSFLEVPELRYNRVTVQVGNRWRSPGGGIIESVTVDVDSSGNKLDTGTVVLHLTKGDYGKVAAGDICMGIYHDGLTLDNNFGEDFDDRQGNFKFCGFFTCYFKVTEIMETAKNSSFRYKLRETSENWPFSFHPCTAMNFVSYGSFTDTSRQACVYEALTYTRMLRNVNTWEFAQANVGLQFGDLSGMTRTLKGEPIQLSGYGLYVNDNIFFEGVTVQLDDVQLDEIKSQIGYIYTLDLTNENSTVNCDSSGVVIGTIEGTEANVYCGKNLDTTWTITIDDPDGATATIENGVVTVESVTKDTTSIKIKASKEGFPDRNEIYTITKVYAGAAGQAAVSYSLVPSTNVVKIDKFAVYSATAVSCGLVKTTGSSREVLASIPSGYTMKFSSDNGNSFSNYTLGSSINTNTVTTALVFVLYNSENNIVDSETIPLLKDGSDGKDYEYIFARTTSSLSPSTPSTSQSDDYVPSGWTDDPSGVTSTYVYEWVSSRQKINGIWSSFSTPAIWTKYSADGAPGKDGKGIDNIVKRYLATSASSGVTASSGSWSYSMVAPTSTNKYLWCWTNTYYTDGTYDIDYQIIAVYGNTGLPGSNGKAIVDCGTYDSTAKYYYSASEIDYCLNTDNLTYIRKEVSGETYCQNIPCTNTTYWERASYYSVLQAYTFLSERGKLGKFSYDTDGYFRSNDVDSNNVANLYFNSKTGFFHCINADISGKITATSGSIGKFNIYDSTNANYPDQLVATDELGNTMILGPKMIRFFNADTAANINMMFGNDVSANLFSTQYTGMYIKIARSVSYTPGRRNTTVGVNTGICLDVTGMIDYSATNEAGNNALTIPHGHIVGFRPGIISVGSYRHVNIYDTFIYTNSYSDFTIGMEYSSYDTMYKYEYGQMVIVRKCGSGSVTLTGTFMTVGQSGATTTNQKLNNGDMAFMFWCGAYWTINIISYLSWR